MHFSIDLSRLPENPKTVATFIVVVLEIGKEEEQTSSHRTAIKKIRYETRTEMVVFYVHRDRKRTA